MVFGMCAYSCHSYMKISPRPMFWAQVVATIIAGTVQLAVQAWMFSNIKSVFLFIFYKTRTRNVDYFTVGFATRNRRTTLPVSQRRFLVPLPLL